MNPKNTKKAALALSLTFAFLLGAQTKANELEVEKIKDEIPAYPEYKTSGLVEIEMPRGTQVKIGIDPDTIKIDQKSGVVSYVVISKGPSAVNASFEAIRCKTAEWRTYARQIGGQAKKQEWQAAGNTDWKPLRNSEKAHIAYPYRLARDGICDGSAAVQTPAKIIKNLKTLDKSLYQ